MFKTAMLMALLSLASTYTFADHDRFQSNQDLVIGANDKPGDVTCLHCSIYVRGEVTGDVTAIAGNVVLESGAQVHGDTTSVFGDIRLAPETSAGRDVTAVGGSIQSDPRAAIQGEVTALEGRGWMLLIVVLPLVFVGGFLALVASLIVWLVRRNNQRVPVAA